MAEDMNKKVEEQTKEIYAAIGRFAVEFEHICNYMRITTMSILAIQGLKNDNVLKMLVANYTAEPLRSLLESLIAETIELTDAERKIVKRILADVQDITATRNDVIHGTWFIGWAYSEKDEAKVAPGVKYKRNKDGVTTKTFNWTAKNFEELAEDAVVLWGLLAKLNGCICGNYRVENNFTVGEDGAVAEAVGMYK